MRKSGKNVDFNNKLRILTNHRTEKYMLVNCEIVTQSGIRALLKHDL